MVFTNMTRKQANVLYRASKNNEIEMPKDLMSFAYNRADQMYSHDTVDDDVETELRAAIDRIFQNDVAGAQECINGAWLTYSAHHGIKAE